jgi:hypothetical protein
MSSKRKILSARANGAKNRGAKTPEAAQRSAANNLKHGLVAHTVVLEEENLQAFTDLLTVYERRLQPQNEIETALVETIVVCRWRLLRLWSIERSSLKIEMDKHDAGEKSPSIRAAIAFRTLSDDSRSLDLINRYETRYDRQISRSLNMLHKLQSQSPNQFCRSEPIPNSNTECAPPPGSMCDRPPGLSPDPIQSSEPESATLPSPNPIQSASPAEPLVPTGLSPAPISPSPRLSVEELRPNPSPPPQNS